MCSYNKVNGVSASEHRWLLTEVLRDEWGFDGLVVSDWGAVYHRVPALEAGLDLEMPPDLGRSPEQVVAAVAAGELSEALLDQRVRTVLDLVSKGMRVLELDEDFDADAHHALARRAAAESVVLLRNTDDLLPLPADASVALIGEFARTSRYQGAGSSQVNPTRVENLVDELRAAHADVSFAVGYRIDDDTSDDVDLRDDAVAAARSADVVVMVVGLPGSHESEGFDRTHMRLPADQLEVLAAVAEVNPNMVVVLVNGSTVELDDVSRHATALVEAWLSGQAAAGGIADVLTGRVNPSGRLAESFPHRLEDNSSYLNFPGDSQVVRYGEGLYIGYRGYDKQKQDVAFPFGFGLSYTSFEMTDLAVDVSRGRRRRHTHRVRGGDRHQHGCDGRSARRAGVRARSGVERAPTSAGAERLRPRNPRTGTQPARAVRTRPAGPLLLVRAVQPLGRRGRPVRHRGRPPLPRPAADRHHRHRRPTAASATDRRFHTARVGRRPHRPGTARRGRRSRGSRPAA
jgi:beta-glucosidase